MHTSRRPTSTTRGRNKGPSRVDVVVGQRIRLRRTVLQLPQQALADLLGVAVQQVQKYEVGQNRISAGRLHDLAKILKVPLDWFFEDVSDDIPAEFRPMMKKSVSSQIDWEDRGGGQDDIVRLLTYYQKIESPEGKRLLVEVAKMLAKA